MALTAESWPIAAALLPFPGVRRDGTVMQDASAAAWEDTFRVVADAGFSSADLTDSWVRAGDLSDARLDELRAAADAAAVDLPALSAIRRSVIDDERADDNLAYSHRTLDAAARLGMTVVSFGLHRALTPEQRARLWFWTAEGHRDPDDASTWNAAVRRFRELGRHAAELGLLMSLEMYEDTYLGTGDSAVRLVEDIGLDNVGLNPDVGNLIRLHRPVEDWWSILEKVLPYSNYWHLKNYVRDEIPEKDVYVAMPSPMESGLIDYREAFELAIRCGFQGILCVENYGGDGLSVSASNRDYLRRRVLPRHGGYPLGASRVLQRSTRSEHGAPSTEEREQ